MSGLKGLEKLEKLDLNISCVLNNIVTQMSDLGVQLDNTYNVISNYMAYDLLEYKLISPESISYVYSVILEKYNVFFEQLQYINIEELTPNMIKNLKDATLVQEISMFRLKNNLSLELGGQIKIVEIDIKDFIENTIDIYNIRDKIEYIINKDKDFEHILFYYDYISDYKKYIKLNDDNYNKENTENKNIIFDKNKLIEELIEVLIKELQKNDKLIVIENSNEDNKWDESVIIIEISDMLCEKKIYFYLDLIKRQNINKNTEIINLDINNKMFVISYDDMRDDYHNYYEYMLGFIKHIIEINF
jgi:hypothetical protein